MRLVVTLAVNLVLLTLVMSPLRRLATLMGHIDPMRPGQRALGERLGEHAR